MKALLLLACVLSAAPDGSALPNLKPECHSSGSATACGFHCKIHFGVVKCAQTPEGICVIQDGKPVCWDPPEAVRLHPPAHPARASCHSKYREVACGYSCTSSPSHLRCAQTPYGVCLTRYGDVTCWDPPAQLIHQFGHTLPKPRCVVTDREVACGYECKVSGNAAACAQTPAGTCTADWGKVTCFDPPLAASEHHAHSQAR